MKILTFTSLFPNPEMPSNGVFVKNRLVKLVDSKKVESKVLVPVPWFPWLHLISDEYKKYRNVRKNEKIDGLDIVYVRYLHIPKIGMVLQPFSMAMTSIFAAKKILKSGYKFQLIDAHYFYPDGVAAGIMAKLLKIPYIVTARGTDINLIPQFTLPRRMIIWSAKRATGIVTVCKALKDALIEMGIDAAKIVVLRNGVDLQTFRPPEQRDKLRAELGLQNKTILSVGHLVERKGHHLVIEALKEIPDVELLIAGAGEENNRLRELVKKLDLTARVKFLGAIPHTQLRDYYGAADALVLASSREGWANVLLESLACGTPVVATNIWGTPEVIATPDAGVLADARTPSSIATAIKNLFQNYPDRIKTRTYAEKFSWDDTTAGQITLMGSIVG